MIGEILRGEVRKALETLGASDVAFTIEPTELTHGDYATNAALVAGKMLKKNPRDVAESLKKALEKGKSKLVGSVDVAGPGFVNIRLSEKALSDVLTSTTKEKHVGWNTALKGKNYIVEYTDPNPFKEFHIGHLMSNTIGEALSRLVEASGADTKRACYQGDIGLHVAKAVWGMSTERQNNTEVVKLKLFGASVPDFARMLGKWYAHGASEYENNPKAKESIQKINNQLYKLIGKKNEDLPPGWDKLLTYYYEIGREGSLEYFETIYKRLGTEFHYKFFESETGTFGKELVVKNVGKVFEKSEGAIVYIGEESKGLHTRVFINKEGLPTYEAKELGLAKIKYDTYPYEHSIVISANEINDYFRVLLDAMSKIFPDLAAKTEHIGHGMMRLPSGKMSSRTGDVITAESMIEEVKEKVLEKMKDNDVERKDEVAEEVAIAAIKYSILRQAPGKDIIFNLEQATSFEGDSGPYIQYTFARIQALLRKGKEKGLMPDTSHIEHGTLSRYLARFSDIVLRAQEERAPQHVATYLIELAQEFNSYYGNTQIVDEAHKDISSGRLALAKAVGETIRSGLWMLGIKAPLAM